MTLSDAYQKWADAHGGLFIKSAAGTWSVTDADGAVVARGALSKAEAARLYCEDQDITPAHPDAILIRVFAEYAPYNTMPAFTEGYRAYQLDGQCRRNPHTDVAAQAWDRGASSAMLYQRALAHLDAHPADRVPETASEGWLARLIRNGGR
jgi:hypothetical protein